MLFVRVFVVVCSYMFYCMMFCYSCVVLVVVVDVVFLVLRGSCVCVYIYICLRVFSNCAPVLWFYSCVCVVVVVVVAAVVVFLCVVFYDYVLMLCFVCLYVCVP